MVSKKNRDLLITGVLIIIGLQFFGAIDLFSAIGFDDFLIEDDFSVASPALIGKGTCSSANRVNTCTDDKWQTVRTSLPGRHPCPGQGASSSTTVSDGKLVLTANSATTAKATYQLNLKDKDIKTNYKLSVGTPGHQTAGGGFSVYLGNQKVHSDSMSFTFSKLGRSGSKEYLLRLIKDIEEEDLFYIEVNGKVTGNITITETIAKLKFEVGSGGSQCHQSSASLTIDQVKARPYFNCAVDSDEVVVRDVFNEGSTFTIRDLTYPRVSQFCVEEYPIIKRSLTKKGIRADKLGTLTNKLVKGQSITVGSGETIEVYAIVDFVEGMGNRCTLDSAWDTTLKKCVKIIEEEEDVVQLQNITQFVTVGADDVLFKGSTKIGDATLTSKKPKYTCHSQDKKAIAPSPQASCWTTVVDYDGEETTFKYGETKNIHSLVKLKYFADARYKQDTGKSTSSVQNDYVNHFLLTVGDILDITAKFDDTFYVLFGKDHDIKFEVNNKLSKFDNSGIQVRETRKLLTSQSTQQKIIRFGSGTNEYSYPVNSNVFGKVDYEITFWYEIAGQKFFDDEKVVRSFEIVDKIPTDVKVLINETVVEKVNETTVIKTVEKIVKGEGDSNTGLIVGIVAGVIALFYFIFEAGPNKGIFRRRQT
tara:strand:+ start:145 stop:2082 length:1938 start_codon:yes stop_codon:yes gene_type:complete